MGSIPIGSAIDSSAGPPDGPPPARRAFVGRRVAAFTYDLLLLAALWMVATLAIVVARGGAAVPAGNPAYQSLLALIATGFFVGFWLRGGQTLGMRAWRLKVVTESDGPLALPSALRRFGWGCLSLVTLGAGLWWAWLDRDGLAWHDRRAGTRVVLLPGPRERG